MTTRAPVLMRQSTVLVSLVSAGRLRLVLVIALCYFMQLVHCGMALGSSRRCLADCILLVKIMRLVVIILLLDTRSAVEALLRLI